MNSDRDLATCIIKIRYANLGPVNGVPNPKKREGAINSGGKTAGLVLDYRKSTLARGSRWVRYLQVWRRSLSLLAPLCLTTQVTDQRIFTGLTPVCSPTQNQEPILPAFSCIYLWLVVGLLIFHRYSMHPP